MDNSNLTLALLYASHGITVFPCHETGQKVKSPYTLKGFYDATTNEERIRGWWTKWPYALVGLPCRPNNIIVLDADRHSDVDGVEALKQVFQENKVAFLSPCVATPNNGMHYIYRLPQDLDATKATLVTAVDVKDKGYIIAAGSVLPDGKCYQLKNGNMNRLVSEIGTNTLPELPACIVELIRKPTPQPTPPHTPRKASEKSLTSPSQNSAGQSEYVQAAIRAEAEKLAGTKIGGRNTQLNTSTFSIATMAQPENVCRTHVESIFRQACVINGLIDGDDDTEFTATFDAAWRDGENKPRESVAEREARMLAAVDIDSGLPKTTAPTAQSSTSLTPLGDRAIMRRVSDVEAEHVRWLWVGRVAVGKLTLIAGDPGLGKSQLTAFMAAKVSTGGEWPNNGGVAPIGSVIMFSCEDDIADTIRPRLEAVDADLSRIHVVEAVEEKGKLRGFNMVDDIPKLEKLLQENKGVIIVFIDPITEYMGKTDSHKTGDVRGNLAPLRNLASRYNVAIVAVTHLNKNGGNGKAINAVTGSNAYVAAARAAFLVAKNPNDENQRYLLQLKNNLANTEALSFTVESKLLSNGIEAPCIVFSDEVVNITADEVLGALGTKSSDNSAAHAAEEFLHEELKNGAVLANELIARAKEVSITSRI